MTIWICVVRKARRGLAGNWRRRSWRRRRRLVENSGDAAVLINGRRIVVNNMYCKRARTDIRIARIEIGVFARERPGRTRGSASGTGHDVAAKIALVDVEIVVSRRQQPTDVNMHSLLRACPI